MGPCPHPWCIGPVGAVRWYLLLSQRLIHENFNRLTSQRVDSHTGKRGGGPFISIIPCRISELLRNFFISGNIAKLKLFSDMKKHKTITVQLS